MSARLDFTGLAADLLSRSREFLLSLFPAGKIHGHEFKVGNIRGEPGESLSINLNTGLGKDFATGETFSDLIAVYAAARGLSQGEAAKELGVRQNNTPAPTRQSPPPQTLAPPPPGMPEPDGRHYKHGPPSALYRYTDTAGNLIHFIARYDLPQGKQLAPWSWDTSTQAWVAKAFPKPRPLYNLAELASRSVILVEGEKCVDYLRRLSTTRCPITWSGGSQATKYTDWSPLAGRDVLLFPDHDDPGFECMTEIAGRLLTLGCVVSIIDHRNEELPKGWDVADTTWTSQELNAWARPLIRPITPPVPRETEPPADDQPPPHTDDDIPVDNVTPLRRTKPRAERESRTVNNPTEVSAYVTWENLGLARNGKGVPFSNLHNVQLIIGNHPDLVGHIWYDEFQQRIYTDLFGPKPEAWMDHHTLKLTSWIQSTLRMHQLSDGIVDKAVNTMSRMDSRHEVRDWLNGLPAWDEIPRLETLMADGWGTPQSDYTAGVGRCWVVSMVARVFEPGCKVDYFPVFEGAQGKKKSTAIEALVGQRWFTELHEDIHKKDFFMALQGKWVTEFVEFDQYGSSRDKKRLKGIVTCKHDRFRAPYDRHPAEHARQNVYSATCNRDDWNTDDTGARRNWPIRCGDISIGYIRNAREQLFAEALFIYNKSERWADAETRMREKSDWWTIDETAAQAEQDDRRDLDAWHEKIADYVQNLTQVTTDEILQNCLSLPLADRDDRSQKRVASVLRLLKFERTRMWVNGRQVRVYKVTGSRAKNDFPSY